MPSETQARPSRVEIAIEGDACGYRKPYRKRSSRSMEWRIREYVRLLDDGWGRNYARARAGLRLGRKSCQDAMKDPRVIAAHDRNREAFLAKKRWC